MTPRVAGTPIDDFLAGGAGSSAAERWEAVGAGVGLAGTLLAVGAVTFVAIVHRGRASDVHRLLLLAMAGGALMLVGGVIEIAGTAQLLDIGWLDALTDGSASAAMLRLLGGLLVLLGLGDETVVIEPTVDGPAQEPRERWAVGATSAFGAVGVVLGVLSFSFDGHTVSQGPRLVHAAVNVVHVTAGGIWFGGVVALAMLAAVRSTDDAFGPSIVSFSQLATVALGAVFVAGVALSSLVLDDPGQLTGTEWGRRLLVKVAAVGVAVLIGAFHHRVVVPRFQAGDPAVVSVARRSLLLEATVLVVVVVLSALLTRSSIV